jgi:hypothetical protein
MPIGAFPQETGSERQPARFRDTFADKWLELLGGQSQMRRRPRGQRLSTLRAVGFTVIFIVALGNVVTETG